MCYFSYMFSHPKETVDIICHELSNPKFGCVDFIVGTGVSGILPLVSVSLQSGIPYGVVRKLESNTHSDKIVERASNYVPRRYVIIDDFIESGLTIDKIIHEMTNRFRLRSVECIGIILYQTPSCSCRPVWKNIPIAYVCDNISELYKIRQEEEYDR